MAKIDLSDFAEFEFDLEQWANMPSALIDKMVEVQLPIAEQAAKSEGHLMQTSGRYYNGATAASVGHGRITHKPTETASHVYPKGKNKKGNRNAEVGFVWEFGATTNVGTKIPPVQWMRIAAEKCSEECADAAKEVYDQYMDSINL